MRAGLVTGHQRLELVEVPEPEPGEGVAVVAIERCGICGSDVSAYRHGEWYPPFLCGHEWCGTVIDVGPDVTALTGGDRVVLGTPPACGRCPECRAGLAHRCAGIMDVQGDRPEPPRHGGYAERIAVDARRLIPIPADLPSEIAAQLEPTTVALHGVRLTPMRAGDVVAVQGCGPIGLLAMQWARLAGAADVIAIEPDADRQARAAALGASMCVAPGAEAVAAVRSRNGLGADVVLECAGTANALDAAVALTRPGGAVTMIGVPSMPVTVDPRLWLIREVTVRTSLAHTHEEFAMALAFLVDGRIAVTPLHDRTIGLDELADAFAALAAGSSGLCKVLVDPSD